MRFDQLVQPILNANCVSCHQAQATNVLAAKLDLTPAKSYDTLVSFGKPSLQDQVMQGYQLGTSIAGSGIAQKSKLLELLLQGHQGVKLDANSRERLLTWLDTYAQRLGHFSDAQERELIQLREASVNLFETHPTHTAAGN